MKDKFEKTLVIIKPDAIQRNLLGEIIQRFERKGLQIVGLKMMQIEDLLINDHYSHHQDKPFFEGLKRFMQSSPVVVMALAGINAISAVRLIVGPLKSYEADAGTIRGDFSLSLQSNIVHASDSLETAKIELERFFKADEFCEYNRVLDPYFYAEESF